VLRVHVSDDEPVQAGDLLVEIDPDDFAATLVQASARAAEARGRLEQARWQLLSAKASRTLAAADLVAVRDRGRNTADEHTAELELTVAQAKQVAAEAQVNLARAQIETAAAGVVAADVAVERARIGLAHTKIHAPRTGRVRMRSVESGDYVQVGQELLALSSDDLDSPATARQRFGPTPPAANPHAEGRHGAAGWTRAEAGVGARMRPEVRS
jgi:membrane fusion protein (multidrug efflux system)